MGTAASKRIASAFAKVGGVTHDGSNEPAEGGSVQGLVGSGAAKELERAVVASKAARQELRECGISKCSEQYEQLQAVHGGVLERRKQLQEDAAQYIQRMSGIMRDIADTRDSRQKYARLTSEMLGMEIKMQVLKHQQAALAADLASVVESVEEEAYLRCLVQDGKCKREALEALRTERDLMRVGQVYERAADQLESDVKESRAIPTTKRHPDIYYNDRINNDAINSDTLVAIVKKRMQQGNRA